MRIFFLIFLLITSLANADETACGDDYSYLVFDFENHQILSEKKADRILYPASLTKVMTLYLTFEALQKGKLNLDQKLKFSAYAEEVSNINKYNTLHAKEGEVISLRQAIQSVIIKSYNEAAIVLAEAVAGDEWKFVRLMNKKARELGMINTSFRNASGLHEDGQYTTAYDLARLTIAIKKKFPAYYHFFAEKKFKYRGEEYETHNKIILEYQGAEGLKTGFTNASGYNLISVAKRKGRRIASILLRCSNLEKRGLLTVELLDKGFKAEGGHGFYRNKIIDAFDYSSPQLSSFGLR